MALKGKVVFCTPSLNGITAPFRDSLAASLPLIEAAGWEHKFVQEFGNPYISAARATMTRKALTAKADVIVYLDYDLSWRPEDLLTLIEAEGFVVAGTYRMKREPEEYMGQLIHDDDGFPIIREDGCLQASLAPAGFLKVTKEALLLLARKFPELLYGDPFNYAIDLFNHGAYNGVWWGEDYAFCQRCSRAGIAIWTPPDLMLDHHLVGTDKVYKGHLHMFLSKQPGGANYNPTEHALYMAALKLSQRSEEHERY